MPCPAGHITVPGSAGHISMPCSAGHITVPCPAGHIPVLCPAGHIPIPCPAGHIPMPCPAGHIPMPCPAGHITVPCPVGHIPIPCPAGHTCIPMFCLIEHTCTTSITAPHQCSCSARYNGLDIDAHISQALGCVQAGAPINGYTKSGRARVVERYLICQHCLIHSGGEGRLC